MGGPAKDSVQLDNIQHFVPSRYNARTLTADGFLVVYNSLTGGVSGFPPAARQSVEAKLKHPGFTGPLQGITKYLYERGFLVLQGTNELQRCRMLYGNQHFRQDRLELILLSSEECNFRCSYCYETFQRGTMEPWVREAIVRMVEQRAQRLNELNITWFGGEPLLGYEAIEEIAPQLLALAEKHGITYSSHMTTNGYLLTPECFQKLVRWKVLSYQITMDGIRGDHDAHRVLKTGGPTFDVILSNLRELRQFKEEFHVTVRINIDKSNVPHMADFIDVIKGVFQEDRRFNVRFYPIGKWGGVNDDGLQVCGNQAEEVRHALEIETLARNVAVESRLPYMQAQTELAVCYAARPDNLIIGADGKIMKCTVVLDKRDCNVIGTMSRDGVADIKVDKLWKWVAPYFEDDLDCRRCFYLPVCQGCSCPRKRVEEKLRPCPPEKVRVGSALRALWLARQRSGHRYGLEKSAITT
jgi:uncharacterized protein